MKNTKQIEDFAARDLLARTGYEILPGQTVVTEASGDDLLRIVCNLNSAYISVDEAHKQILDHLSKLKLSEIIRSPLLYRDILVVMGLDVSGYLLEPSEEYVRDIEYNCTHTLEFVCSEEIFSPAGTKEVVTICRGDERYILSEAFDDRLFCVLHDERIISVSYFRPNGGDFANTRSMQVYTRPKHRQRGYGRMTASAATAAAIDGGKLALWVVQVENTPSIRIAESLGYMFLGGELRIKKKR